jgi:hypothetical protein
MKKLTLDEATLFKTLYTSQKWRGVFQCLRQEVTLGAGGDLQGRVQEVRHQTPDRSQIQGAAEGCTCVQTWRGLPSKPNTHTGPGVNGACSTPHLESHKTLGVLVRCLGGAHLSQLLGMSVKRSCVPALPDKS